MDARELRIGNYVDLSEGFSVHKDIITVSLKNIAWHNEFTPIPLTEEWLLKFGFNTTDLGYYNLTFNFEGQKLIYFEVNENDGLYDVYFHNNFIKHIDEIHELQNLYFALTNQELTIK